VFPLKAAKITADAPAQDFCLNSFWQYEIAAIIIGIIVAPQFVLAASWTQRPAAFAEPGEIALPVIIVQIDLPFFCALWMCRMHRSFLLQKVCQEEMRLTIDPL
jgi:hypothetical protein